MKHRVAWILVLIVEASFIAWGAIDRKSTRLNSSH